MTGLDAPTFAENTINTTPQVIDADVVFTDAEGDFDGGTLTVSGLLAEDTVSVRNQGTGAGQVGLSGANVTYEGVIIGTLAGGVGGTLTITFNASATSAAVDAVLQNLTYANSSDTPTASRTLTINVTDAAGNGLGGAPSFTDRTGAANPFNGVDVGAYRSIPTFADLDGDGDLDAVVGASDGVLNYFENTGTDVAPVFTQRTGGANPFNGVDVGYYSAPTFADLDGDGDLDAVVGDNYGTLNYFRNTGTDLAPVFAFSVTANPFNGVDVGYFSAPTFADLDGDGDLDAVVGGGDGSLNYFENTGTDVAPVFTQRTGAANPFNGVDVGFWSTPTFADLDGDGDLDAVVGENDGVLNYFENTGTDVAPVFTQRTGAANPFNGVDVGYSSAPTFADLDGDGDLDAVVGEGYGNLLYFENTTVAAPSITVTVTTENDAPTATGLPTDVTVTEDVASNLNLSAVTIADVDTSGSITVVLTASAGTMTATSGGGVTVTNSGTGAITLTGTASAIDTFLNTASAIQYTGALNASGNDAATVTVTANDGSGAVTLGVVNVDITAVDDPMSLTGFAPTVTFGENLVNATPQLLDADVSFTGGEGFDGGALTLSGLLAEDTISVRNEGNGAGQIGLSGANVSFGGVVIGTLAGGAGATLTITFNANATSEAIDALIENLTYANSSDTPTASRDLLLNITDAAGNDLGASGSPSFTDRTGAANPFNGVDIGRYSTPTFADLDGDGDLDAVVGELDGILNYFENTGTDVAPVFVEQTGGDNPFDGVDIDFRSTPTFVDLDGDGDLDAVVGEYDGILNYFENTGTALAPVFTERTGGDNPFNGVDVGYYSTPAFADLDGDGDLDAVVGELNGTLLYFRNTGTDLAPVFVQQTGAANPFNGVDVGSYSTPTFADLDGDGDLDAVVGEGDGNLNYFRNTGTASAPVFAQQTGANNPFNGVDVGFRSNPTFADLDGDGDLDAMVGERYGFLNYFENTGQTITVTVTAEADGPTTGTDTFTGTVGADTLQGLAGDDILDGGDGDDTLEGGEGDDDLTGGDGDDVLSGGTGDDTMAGGTGNDTYWVREAGDVVDETGGDGIDTVRSMSSHTLAAGVENLILWFGQPLSGTGNDLDNVITGNGGANLLTGLAGDDTLIGGSGDDSLLGGDDDDSLDGGAGDDSLDGGDGTDTLSGGSGADRLDGGTGADAMTGGTGADTYVVDDAGDTVTELAGGGTDTVEAGVSYTLGDHVENLTLTGVAVTGTGNALNNVITGNGSNNTLIGGAGADSLTGGLGGDVFLFSDSDIGAGLVTDRILDLVFADGDVIDLSGIDANSLLDGDQAFSFVAKFTKAAGQATLAYSATKDVTTLSVDINGDGKADYAIAITGDHRGTTGNLYTGAGDTDGGWVL